MNVVRFECNFPMKHTQVTDKLFHLEPITRIWISVYLTAPATISFWAHLTLLFQLRQSGLTVEWWMKPNMKGEELNKVIKWFCYFKLSWNLCRYFIIIPEYKAIELHTWTAGWGFQKFHTIGTWRWQDCQPYSTGRLYPPGNTVGTYVS